MKFRRGDIVIALFPNADGSPPKARPVLVIQSDIYNLKLGNVIVAAITTDLKHSRDPASFLIVANTPEGRSTGLRQDCVVSCINLATIHESLIAKKIGHFSQFHMERANDCLKVALAIA